MAQIPYKTRLAKRFNREREKLGQDWKIKLSKFDRFFDTKLGSDFMARASAAITDPRRISVERLEKVVFAMEELSGTYKEQAYENH